MILPKTFNKPAKMLSSENLHKIYMNDVYYRPSAESLGFKHHFVFFDRFNYILLHGDRNSYVKNLNKYQLKYDIILNKLNSFTLNGTKELFQIFPMAIVEEINNPKDKHYCYTWKL